MKNLTDICNESILGDIDVSIQKTHTVFKQAEIELSTIKNLTWENILDTAKFENGRVSCIFKVICPNVLTLLGINNPDADGLIIIVEIDAYYNGYAVLTIKHKKQRDYKTSMITKSWVNITNYIDAIRPKRLSVTIKQIQNALNKIADIDTLKDICSEFKKD